VVDVRGEGRRLNAEALRRRGGQGKGGKRRRLNAEALRRREGQGKGGKRRRLNAEALRRREGQGKGGKRRRLNAEALRRREGQGKGERGYTQVCASLRLCQSPFSCGLQFWGQSYGRGRGRGERRAERRLDVYGRAAGSAQPSPRDPGRGRRAMTRAVCARQEAVRRPALPWRSPLARAHQHNCHRFSNSRNADLQRV
jgi:hypothetical protein